MPDWVIWVVLGFIFFRVRARNRAWARRGLRSFPSCGTPARQRHSRQAAVGANQPGALPPESPLDLLKRRYVEGSISVEQYEDELDRLFSRRS
jgi:hypothetical protein